ncbi:MAG: putative membrane protein [Saprospiraceae bacterium]|jgi:uncharacterized membrane protein
MKAEKIFTADVKALIVQAIEKAELSTSGEVRLHVDDYCKDEVLNRAAFIFEKLEMHKTDLRNGVLFYVAVVDRKFAILGDVGINEKVADDFWDGVKDVVLSGFKEDKHAEALSAGIIKAGEQLKAHFPYQEDDVNELDNEISFGDD